MIARKAQAAEAPVPKKAVPKKVKKATARATKAAPPVNEEPEEEKESEEEEEPEGPREKTPMMEPAPIMENAGAASATLLSDVLRTNGERVDLSWCGGHNHMWKSLSSLKKKKTASQQACVVCALKRKGGWKVKRAFNGTQFCVNCSRPEFNHYFVACSVIHEGEKYSCQFLSHLVVD